MLFILTIREDRTSPVWHSYEHGCWWLGGVRQALRHQEPRCRLISNEVFWLLHQKGPVTHFNGNSNSTDNLWPCNSIPGYHIVVIFCTCQSPVTSVPKWKWPLNGGQEKRHLCLRGNIFLCLLMEIPNILLQNHWWYVSNIFMVHDSFVSKREMLSIN